jgi:uncharacterized cupredoxin-like copper-binding protein
MNPIKTAAWRVAMGLCAGAQAHSDEAHRKSGPIRKEQQDWGIAGDAKSVKRTIQVGMSDAMRFAPDAITVRRGEAVKFVFRNEGDQLHEFVLGTRKELEVHAAPMLKFPNMAHDDPSMAHVPAGKAAEIIWTFNRPGDFDVACLIAGHCLAGMVGKITVSAK